IDAASAYRNALSQYEQKLRQEQAATPAPKKTEGAAFQQGERVVLESGRHGVITKVDTVTMQTIGPYGEDRTRSRSHYYNVKSDSGTEFYTSEKAITREEGQPPTAIPDINVDGGFKEPDQVQQAVNYSKHAARNSEAAAQRARKPENIRDAKKRAETARQRAALYQTAFDEWAAKYPDEAKKYLPEKAVPSQGVAIATGQTTATTTAPAPAPVFKEVSPPVQKPAPSLGKAASEVAAGVASSYDALAEIMKRAGKGPISMMGTGVFDEELYQVMKPHLQATYDHFRAAALEVKDWMKETISQFTARGFEPQAILPYIKRFYMEVTKNDLTKGETAATLNTTKGGVGHEEGISRGQSPSGTLETVAGTPGLDAGKLSRPGEGTLPDRKTKSVSGQKSGTRLEDDLQPERQGEEHGGGPGSGKPVHPVAPERPGIPRQTAGAAAGETGSRNLEVGGEPARRSRQSDRGLGVNTRIEPADVLFHSGKAARINANIRAIELSKQLVSENRDATPAEQKILLQFSGWGAVAQDIFNPEYDD
ncbi:MAG: hypothetical protein CVU53_07235, partial [Deltaproteobacteria bacterium HGW-Deltaproteobacteria-11]